MPPEFSLLSLTWLRNAFSRVCSSIADVPGVGVVATEIDDACAAAKGGLRAGDVVLSIGSERIDAAAQLRGVLGRVLGEPRCIHEPAPCTSRGRSCCGPCTAVAVD